MRYLPQVAAATALVAVVPVAAVWWLRAERVISSPYLGVAVAMGLSLAASFAGSAYWKRRRGSGDLVFSELLIWGWLRRLRVERRLADATEVLGLAGAGDRRGDDGLNEAQRAHALKQLAAAREAEDSYLDGHSRRVARHAAMIAREIGLSREMEAKVRAAADVHDVGKLYVPAEILNKPDRLTDAEFAIVKRHAEDGAAMVAGLRDPELTAIVRHHHERLDGGGYPSGLRGEEIPLGARIVAVADTFDAITSARAYRPAAPHKRALDILAAEAGTQLDPAAVRAFLHYYRGKGVAAAWALAAVTPQRAFARARARGGTSGGASLGQVAATTAATVAVGAAAISAPVGPGAAPSQASPPDQIAATPSPAVRSTPRGASRPKTARRSGAPTRRHWRTEPDSRRVPTAAGEEHSPSSGGRGPLGDQDPGAGSGDGSAGSPTGSPGGSPPGGSGDSPTGGSTSAPSGAVPSGSGGSPPGGSTSAPSGAVPSGSGGSTHPRKGPRQRKAPRGQSGAHRQDGSDQYSGPGQSSPVAAELIEPGEDARPVKPPAPAQAHDNKTKPAG
jgi:hypothetical protein